MDGPERTREAKRRLRRELRAERRAVSGAIRRAQAEVLLGLAAADPALRRAAVIAGYAADDGELDVGPILERFGRAGARLVLPRLSRGGALELVEVGQDALPRAGASGGIPEPPGAPVAIDALPAAGVVLAPCVAADRRGGRLGRGGGHYDRLLPRLQERGWQTVAVCLADHLHEDLPREPHDVSVERVLTERGWVEASPEPRRGSRAGVVLAGGRSTRMGRPKDVLEVGGVPMVRRVVATLAACCDQLVVVADPGSDRMERVFSREIERRSLRLLLDDRPYAGPAVALAHTFATLDAELAFVAGCDTPLLAPRLVHGLLDLAGSPRWEAVLPAPRGLLEPLLAVYRVEPMAARLADATRDGPVSLVRVLADARVRRVGDPGLALLDPDGSSLLNVNSESDLAEAARRVSRGAVLS